MKYKFIKVKNILSKNNESHWCFTPRSLEQIKEHWDKYVCPYMEIGIKKIIERISSGDIFLHNRNGHWENDWAYIIELESMNKDENLYDIVNRLESQNKKARLNLFFNSNGIAFPFDTMSILILNDTLKIVDEKELEELKYPFEYKLEDVRYIQWENGEHWYAKICNEDIIDKDGNQKWDTKGDAIKAARYYLENNYKL